MWQLAEDTLGQEDLDALADWLRGGPRLTQGAQVRAFERAFAAWLGVADGVMVSSGSAANFALVAAAAARVARPRPRVGVAAVTWSTNLTPSLLLGHEVTAFDVCPRTLGVDVDQACASMAAGELDILFITHLLGLPAGDERLRATAARHGVILIEDCCEAQGARQAGRRVGAAGLGGTFSFYYGHHMSAVEGGMVASDDAALIDAIRLMRGHGLARESAHFAAYAAAHPEIDPRFLFVAPGLNFRSTELNAFLALRQLARIDDRIAHRNAVCRAFLGDLPPWLWRDFALEGISSFALPVIGADRAAAARAAAVLSEHGVESRPLVAGNLLRQPMCQHAAVRAAPGGTPVADHLHACGAYVGNGHHVSVSAATALAAALAAARP